MSYPQVEFRSERDRLFETGELGSIWGDILGNAVGAGVNLLPSLFGSGGSSSGALPFRGSDAINACGQQAIQAMTQILQMLQARQISPADAVSNADRINSMLSNPSVFYQAQHGDDAAALRNFKSHAANLFSQIQSLAASISVVASGGSATPAGSPSVANTTPAGVSRVDNSTLLLVGGGLLFLLLLK